MHVTREARFGYRSLDSVIVLYRCPLLRLGPKTMFTREAKTIDVGAFPPVALFDRTGVHGSETVVANVGTGGPDSDDESRRPSRW